MPSCPGRRRRTSREGPTMTDPTNSIATRQRVVVVSDPADLADGIRAHDGPWYVVTADTYLAGADGASYMELDRFSAAGLQVIFQAYEHPTYAQLFGDFESHLSTLDLVLNCGPESLDIIRRGRSAGAPSDPDTGSSGP